jgi:hypothetical protein
MNYVNRMHSASTLLFVALQHNSAQLFVALQHNSAQF